MIIVSQDKDNVINYDNVKSLWIDDNVLDKTNTTFYINADDDFLGEYETEERAKEVLKEIWKFYEISKRYECSSNNGITIFLEPKFAYQMPESRVIRRRK